MMNMEAKMMAMKALRRKLRKMELEGAMGDEMSGDGLEQELDNKERGPNNIEEDAREIGEVESAVDGEDGEKEVSIEVEAEGDTEGMSELYKRMAAEFGAEPASREPAGKKKAFMAGQKPAMMMGKSKKR
jgi:hypothetical protein